MENSKYFKIEFYLQLFWIFLAIIGLSSNTIYAFYGIVPSLLPFPVSIFLNFIILGNYPLIGIFNIMFSITELVFFISLIRILFKDRIQKVYMICNMFFSIVLVMYAITCISINDERSLTVVWASILVIGIAFAVYSNVVNIKYKEKEKKITIDNAWNE